MFKQKQAREDDDKSEAIMNASEQHLRSQGIATNVALKEYGFFPSLLLQTKNRRRRDE